MSELSNIDAFIAASPKNLHAFMKFVKHLTSLLLSMSNLDGASEVKFAFDREVSAEILAVIKEGPNDVQKLDLFANFFFRIGLNEPGSTPNALEVAQTAYRSTVEDDRFDEKIMRNSEMLLGNSLAYFRGMLEDAGIWSDMCHFDPLEEPANDFPLE